MADIQSISQGNYILQGTVATSTGIVGDGSTQNPLRADETVLWEDSTGIAAINETATLSESITNFQSVVIYAEPIYGGSLLRNEFEISNNPYRFGTFSQDGSSVYIAEYNMDISDKTLTITRSRRVTISYAGGVSTSTLSATGSYKAPIRKIVGINRIVNN